MIRPPFGRTANSLMPRSISAASRTPIGVASIPIPRRPPGLRRIVRCVRITGITQDRSAGGARRNLPEQLQPFAADVEFKIGEPGCIAARTGEARDKAKLDRIFRNEKGNRDRLRCRFGRDRRYAPRRGDYTHLAADQSVRLLREQVISTFRQAIVDCDILAIDVAAFGEPPRKTSCK